ncbi:flavodoxin [Cellulomonas sp. ATA003]|uniref:flavodoxin n=1 Tax=Cellulomonas sp. ATA003 TaxID=3073064 RepID=UPI002872BF47|nr:flavodoxin [Cellulomonas sp. ATA003]WNB84773.1 flavodoxin [Cellulomonas sp. ATA003]
MTAPSTSRRTFLRAALAGGAGATLLTAAGCTSPDIAQGPTQSQEPPPMTPTPPRGASTLLVYFSRPGENYWYGGRRDLEVGNTEVLAAMIADRIDCDTYRIEGADPYSADYDDTVARNVREKEQDARPAIASPLPDVTGYDTVILPSPIWNVRPPMIMSTFVESVSLDGKRVLPVTTHAMSGLGRAVEVYTELAVGASIGAGLAVQGEEVADAGPELER